MLIEFTVRVTPERIQIQHAEKGTLLNLGNNAAYDPVRGAVLSLGKSAQEMANKLPEAQRAAYLKTTHFTAPFSPQGFADGLARPVLVYLVDKALSRYYDNRWTHALNLMRDRVQVKLEIAGYETVPAEQRQAFEDAIAPLWQTTLNDRDLGAMYEQGKTAGRAYLWINLFVLAGLVLLLVELGSLSAELVQPGDAVGVFLGLIMLYAAAIVILYLGTFLSRLLWVLALRRHLPAAVLKTQMAGDRRLQGSLSFLKQWLESLASH
jgi:hypothetical protein